MARRGCWKPKVASKPTDKIKNIDKHAKVKFNALQDFCQKHGYKFGFIRDKDGELYLNNTEYVDDMSDERWQPLERYI